MNDADSDEDEYEQEGSEDYNKVTTQGIKELFTAWKIVKNVVHSNIELTKLKIYD